MYRSREPGMGKQVGTPTQDFFLALSGGHQAPLRLHIAPTGDCSNTGGT